MRTGELGSADARSFVSRSVAGTPALAVIGDEGGRVFVTLGSLVQAIPVELGGPIEAFPPTS